MNPLMQKVDLFMKLHVLPKFNPDKIYWVFSISGGKDSYVMCKSIHDWYEAHAYTLRASGIYIWQWGENNPKEFLANTFPWIQNLEIIDARTYTAAELSVNNGRQAPCRSCSDIRHHFTDMFFCRFKTKYPILFCRGLHLTDMTISILWRLIWYGPGNQLDGKGKPITPIGNNLFLAKPLCFAREYECQTYANQTEYVPFFCDCPAQKYPSRRDIVEESARQFYTSPIWEFDVPGSTQYLQEIAGCPDISLLKTLCASGHEVKKNIIPDSYYEFARDYFLRINIPNMATDSKVLLENFSASFFYSGQCGELDGFNGCCKLLLTPESLSQFDLRMIGTLGPFWAAISLPNQQRKRFFHMQNQIWNFKPDANWSQVCDLLNLYYENKL